MQKRIGQLSVTGYVCLAICWFLAVPCLSGNMKRKKLNEESEEYNRPIGKKKRRKAI